jgi:hypothetical protein
MQGPHARIPTDSDRDRRLAELLDRLWLAYRERVPYVRQYEDLIAAHGGTFVNDHIAFRTFAGQQPFTGIASISRGFEALGYVPAGCYQFPDKLLAAIHFQHPNGLFPKLFISELQTWLLPEPSRSIVLHALSGHRPPLGNEALRRAARGSDRSLIDEFVESLDGLPWPTPSRGDVETVNRDSQYAAWVLVHGYRVNHFTALVNSHGVAPLCNIDRTVAALQAAGVPMKSEIEGAPGSKLRQTATAAATVNVSVREGSIPWSYAYFELAERGVVIDSETGQAVRFEGFLGPQATQLFEMTRVK